jgi:5'-3' exonuclease
MKVYLVDGTYELFRHFFAVPPQKDASGMEIGAVRGVLGSILGMLEGGATHVGVATDHVIESFRNHLYAGYKTSEGVAPELLAQFPILEDALRLLGVVVWPMVEYEADDALAAGAALAARDPRVEQVLICTPDKDLAQCVVGTRVVQLDRRRNIERDEEGVVAKWGVRPESIPDFLAVVGDSADGYPGLPGWGEKAAAAALSRFAHLEGIPRDWRQWPTSIRGAQRLCSVLEERWEEAALYRALATLRVEAPVCESVDELRWRGPRPEFEAYAGSMGAEGLYRRAVAAAPKLAADVS